MADRDDDAARDVGATPSFASRRDAVAYVAEASAGLARAAERAGFPEAARLLSMAAVDSMACSGGETRGSASAGADPDGG